MFRRKEASSSLEPVDNVESSSPLKKLPSLLSEESSSSSLDAPDCLECSPENAPPASCLLLLAAPTICAILGVALTPKFLVLAVVYLVAAARPLLIALLRRFSRQRCRRHDSDSTSSPLKLPNGDASTATDRNMNFNAMVRTSLNSHRSITVQFSMLAACLFVYEKSRVLCVGKAQQDTTVHIAFASAKSIIMMEHAMGLDFEPLLQTLLLKQHWLVLLGNFYYGVMHFVVPLGVMAVLVLQNRDTHFQHRLSFFLMLMMALIAFVTLPTMPPRLMGRYQHEYGEEHLASLTAQEATALQPYWSIVDTMHKGDTLYAKLHSEGGNPYAAMPSMHTGWALWSAVVALDVLPTSKTTSWLAWGHVFWTVFFILLTGNHFWLDAVGGAVCVFLGRIFARQIVSYFVPKTPSSRRRRSRNEPAETEQFVLERDEESAV